tara:strand:+ start:1624 stop:2232 length:609 start_codon:yes stop_codon:yes gene_type:complete
MQLAGTAFGACLIANPVARKIREICITNDQPFFRAPTDPSSFIYARPQLHGGPFTICYGDPWIMPPTPSWEDYLEGQGADTASEGGIEEWFRVQWGMEEGEEIVVPQIDEPIEGGAFENWLEWDYALRESPEARGFHYMEELELACDEEEEGNTLGELAFIQGDRPGSNLTYVEAADLATLACLQERLNALEQEVGIKIYEG